MRCADNGTIYLHETLHLLKNHNLSAKTGRVVDESRRATEDMLPTLQRNVRGECAATLYRRRWCCSSKLRLPERMRLSFLYNIGEIQGGGLMNKHTKGALAVRFLAELKKRDGG